MSDIQDMGLEAVVVLVPPRVAAWLDSVARHGWDEMCANEFDARWMQRQLADAGYSRANFVGGTVLGAAYEDSTGLDPFGDDGVST